jgi:hypothetical protein
MPEAEEFRDAVRRLHRAKGAAYGNSWKRRGEVMSIIANIARKVDRLENVAGGAPPTPDESLLDTAIDLLVYTLKYQTYLADQDMSVAIMLFQGSNATSPYSDGPSGFEALLARQGMTQINRQQGSEVNQAAREVLNAFAELEACFQGTPVSAQRRGAIAATLADATVSLIASLVRETPERYRDFLSTDSQGSR